MPWEAPDLSSMTVTAMEPSHSRKEIQPKASEVLKALQVLDTAKRPPQMSQSVRWAVTAAEAAMKKSAYRLLTPSST
jgi:hypothetical protein